MCHVDTGGKMYHASVDISSDGVIHSWFPFLTLQFLPGDAIWKSPGRVAGNIGKVTIDVADIMLQFRLFLSLSPRLSGCIFGLTGVFDLLVGYFASGHLEFNGRAKSTDSEMATIRPNDIGALELLDPVRRRL